MMRPNNQPPPAPQPDNDRETQYGETPADSKSRPKVDLTRGEWIAVATLIAVIAQAIIYYYTLGEIRNTAQATQVAANATQRQAGIAQAQATIMAGQTQAVKDSAQAAKDSAAASSTLTEQNKELISATKTQANASLSQAGSSKTAADAAKGSAQTATRLYEAGQRPKIFFKWIQWREKPVANKTFNVDFAVSNNGGTAYNLTTEMTSAVVPVGFQGFLPYGGQGTRDNSAPLIRTDETPLEQGADLTISSNGLMLNEAGATLFEDDQVLIVFYGHLWWKDSLGRGEGFVFCRVYSKKFYPDLPYCPSQMKVPTGKYPY